MSIVLILAHCDDEIFLYSQLVTWQRSGRAFRIYYLTDQGPSREGETLAALRSIGADPSVVFFLGQRLGTADGALDLYLPSSYAALFREVASADVTEIWTHDWENGHPDHDSCFVLAQRLWREVPSAGFYTFSAYNAWRVPAPFFRVMAAPPSATKDALAVSWGLRQGLQNFRLSFFYRSQRLTFLALGPALFWHLVVKKGCNYYAYRAPISLSAAHEGPALRETRFSRGLEASRPYYEELMR